METATPSLIERRRRILAAAAKLFGGSPYDSVQMDDIARAAHVAKPTIYRHFGTKEALFAEAVAGAVEELKTEAHAIADDGGSPLARLERLVAVMFRRIGRLKALIREAEGGGVQMGDLGRAVIRRELRALRQVIAGVVGEGMAAGTFVGVDPELAALVVLGAVRMAADAGGPDPAAAVAKLLLHGLAKNGAHSPLAQWSTA